MILESLAGQVYEKYSWTPPCYTSCPFTVELGLPSLLGLTSFTSDTGRSWMRWNDLLAMLAQATEVWRLGTVLPRFGQGITVSWWGIW